jgi:hypothetical protein
MERGGGVCRAPDAFPIVAAPRLSVCHTRLYCNVSLRVAFFPAISSIFSEVNGRIGAA